MDRAHGEDGSLTGIDGVENEAGTVLADGARRQGAVDGVEDLCGARVRVGSVHAAWSSRER